MSELSYLEKLLDGVEVEWLPLSGLARIRNGKDHKSLSEGEFPVYGSGGIMRYVDTYAYNKPSVLIPRKGSLGNLFFVNVPFWTVDTIFYTEIDEAQIRPKYLYYFLTTVGLGEMNQAGGVPSQTQSVLNKLKIPIPCPDNPEKSLAIQSEIVRILDKFTALTAELTAELTMRKKQYNYYRDQLLSFKEGEVEWKTLGEVAQFKRGTAITQKQTTPGEIPVVANGPIPTYFHSESNRQGETIVIARSGAYAGYVSFWDQPIFLTDAFSVHSDLKIVKPKFIYHVLQNKQEHIHAMKKGAGVPHVRVKEFETYDIPIPPITEQERIVSILDKFDTLTNSITEGLPREIELRQKQYEYYRDLLFSFPKPETVSK
ncbi:TPA: restriction endonuclease subunit S [Escherichia coli]|nr:restriction endonuclease subunit S [Escherichia coli]